VVGYNAALIANGMGSRMTILEKSSSRIDFLKKEFPKADVLSIDDTNIENILPKFDLIIGAVLIPGAQAPKIIKKEHLKIMKKGSVLVDVAIDQGGCFETSKATTHDNPTYIIDDIVHYCVANMPGAVPRTSTISLNSATLPYIQKLADNGVEKFCKDSEHHLNGLNTYLGNLTCKPVADFFNLAYTPPQDLF
jgi:alanine dehydrogenase